MWRTIQIFRVASSHGRQNESRTDSFETTGLGSKQHVFQVWTSCALQLLTGLVDYNSWLLFESLRVLRIIDNRCLTPREVVICYVISFCWWLRFYDMFSISLSGPFFGTDCHKIKSRVKIKAVCTGWTRMEEAIPTHSRPIVIWCHTMEDGPCVTLLMNMSNPGLRSHTMPLFLMELSATEVTATTSQ